MYTLISWRSHLDSVGVDLLHQELARDVKDPFTSYVPEKNSQVLRTTDVHPKLPEKSPRSHCSRVFAAGTC